MQDKKRSTEIVWRLTNDLEKCAIGKLKVSAVERRFQMLLNGPFLKSTDTQSVVYLHAE